jgi:hypothetical protein
VVFVTRSGAKTYKRNRLLEIPEQFVKLVGAYHPFQNSILFRLFVLPDGFLPFLAAVLQDLDFFPD